MNRRQCVRGVMGLAVAAGAAIARNGEAWAQAEGPRKEPPMIAGPDPDTKTPSPAH